MFSQGMACRVRAGSASFGMAVLGGFWQGRLGKFLQGGSSQCGAWCGRRGGFWLVPASLGAA